MPEKTRKPLLHLVVDHDKSYSNWKIASLQLDQGTVIRYGKDSKYSSASPGIRSLSCLIAHQAYLRKLGQDYSKLSPSRHQSLKSVWEAAKGVTPKWQYDLFKEDPFLRFIDSEGGRPNFDVCFTKEIALCVESTANTKELSRKQLLDLRNFLTKPKGAKEEKFIIEILRGNSPISSEVQEGGLIFGDEIQIRASANFTGHLAVFWVSSEHSVAELFPTLEIEIETGTSPADLKVTKEDIQLTIPADTTVRVDTEPGIESCIVLMRNKNFSVAESAQIKQKILQSIPERRTTAKLFQPDFKELSLLSKKSANAKPEENTSDFRLGSSLKLTEWETQLSQDLATSANRFFLFHIPNQ